MSLSARMTTVGIIGAGNIGGTLAQGLVDRGYDVVIANSRGPETLSELVAKLGSHARAATAQEAAEAAEWAIVTVPLKALEDVPVDALAGKIVVDTNNYYWERDGRIAELEEGRTTTSEMVQRHLAQSKVVKGFNHIAAGTILTDGTPAGTPGRRALVASSNDPDAVAFMTGLYDQFGFETVDVSPLSESWRAERDRPAYVIPQNAEELKANLARAER